MQLADLRRDEELILDVNEVFGHLDRCIIEKSERKEWTKTAQAGGKDKFFCQSLEVVLASREN